MTDPLGKLLTEIRDDATVAAITHRVRGEEPRQGDVPPLVIIRTFPIVRNSRVPIGRYQYLIQCYGADPPATAQLRGAVSDAIHNIGPRMSAAGVSIYRSQSEVEGQTQLDPDTSWPFQTIVVVVWAATVLVEAGAGAGS